MNKSITITACAVFIFIACGQLAVNAQEAAIQRPPMNKIIDPETLAREFSDRMKNELKLTDKQYKKVYKLNLKEAKAMTDNNKSGWTGEMKREHGGRGMGHGQMPPGMHPNGIHKGGKTENGDSNNGFSEKIEQIKKREEKLEKNMKKILNEDQFVKWQDMMKKKKENMKHELDLKRQRMELGLPDE